MAKRKPADKFPLWLHPRGFWCKKIKGHFHYFGTDKDKALKEYVRVRDDLEAGRKPRPKADDGATVADVVNNFLTYKRERVDSGELSARTWGEYHLACERVVKTFGRGRVVGDLRPDDFGKLRVAAAKRLGPVALAKFITLVRTLFAYTYKAELVTVPVRYGDLFDKPPKRVMRLERQRKGTRLFPAADVWKLLDKADTQMRAMILLGLNAGYGQKDCADLQCAALAVRPGWLDAPRQKSGVARRCQLWPETRNAVAEVARVRPASNDPADKDCVFITAHGNRWVRHKDRGEDRRGLNLDAVAHAFRKLCKQVGVKAAGGFYTLRHTFRTVADEVKDRPAIDLIMGHADHSMASYYRETIADDRLQAVTDHVRAWLLSGRDESPSDRASGGEDGD